MPSTPQNPAPIRFKLNSESIELYNLLKAAGLCESGGRAKWTISEGKVIVDGTAETRKAAKIFPGSIVEFDGVKIQVE